MGHPEHDLLFIATQVARAAGLKDPATAVSDYRKMRTHEAVPGFSLKALIGEIPVSLPKEPNGRSIRTTTVMFPESALYQMLLRGHAPASEPFRKWVTEVVLPSIRKTGKFEKTLDLIRGSPMMATLSPAPLVRAPRPKATGSPT
ncbi:BRO family protein [Stutzerimonas stutzeri]|uniref:BRO-N domain-containing protein n=1 Tax=Stutzerimonas stutzeri TaxID=316 RepID=UPI0013A58194